MKKLLALVLVLALFVSFAALAEDRDPAIGCWYFNVDGDLYPEYMSNFGDYDFCISIYFFAKNGSIYMLQCDTKNDSANPYYITAGKWSKTDDTYNYSIVGLGEGTFLLDGDIMKIGVPKKSGTTYFNAFKLIPFNPYADFSR